MPDAVRKHSRATGIELIRSLRNFPAALSRQEHQERRFREGRTVANIRPCHRQPAFFRPHRPERPGLPKGWVCACMIISSSRRSLRFGPAASPPSSPAHGTMDKRESAVRERITASADLLAAIRLPEGTFRATAGTDVVTDVLFFQKRRRL